MKGIDVNVVALEGFRFSHYRIPNVPPPAIAEIVAELNRRVGKRRRLENRKEIQGVILHNHESYEKDSRKVTGVVTLLENEAVILEDTDTKILYYDHDRALYILQCIKKDREPTYKTPTERKERLAVLKLKSAKGKQMEETTNPVPTSSQVAIPPQFRIFLTPAELSAWKTGDVTKGQLFALSELEKAKYRVEPIAERPVLKIAPRYLEVLRAIECGEFTPSGKNFRASFRAWVETRWQEEFDSATLEIKFTRYYPDKLQHGWGIIYEDKATGAVLPAISGFERFSFEADQSLKVRRIQRGGEADDEPAPFEIPDVKALSDEDLDALAELIHAERSERLVRQLNEERKALEATQARLAALEARKAALMK